MESDISLIEVAGEDDSLLQQIPEDDILNLERKMEGNTAGNSGFFLCSPLVTDRSNGTIAASSTASSADYTDKENINANSIEGPKLSMMPQQMKRKKKAGGYNLRKSLAWNKAFFTEEGVLDSAELSMITGSSSTSCGAALGVIDEEIPAVSLDLSLKDKLFEDTSTSTPSTGRKNGRCLLPKRGSSTKDNVKLKEPSIKDVSRSGSKRGGCPRPVASSSLKRPTVSTATKTVNKDERISRIPVQKRDPPVISRAPRNATTIRASDAKSNHVAPRAGSIPKTTTLKGPSINAKRGLNKDVNASKSLKAKSSIVQPRRKLANPVLKVNSSRSQHESTDSNEGLKAAANSVISKPLPSNNDGTKKGSASSITQNAPPDDRIRSMLNQTQMPKPSGLRMPSPSMGFFGQKKVSSFQSVPPDTSELHDQSKSNIPNVRITGSSNPICQLATLGPRNVVKASHGQASGETNVVSCLSSGSSLEPVSHDRGKSALKVADIHLGKVNVVGAATMNKVLSTHKMEKPDVRSLSNPLLEHIGDDARIHDEIQDKLEECQPHHVSFNNLCDSTTKSHLDETIDTCSQGIIQKAVDAQLSGAQDCNEQSSEQVELTNSPDCKIERTSPDHERLGIGSCNSLKRSRSSIEFDHDRFDNVSNDSNGQESCSFDQDEDLEIHKMRILRTRKAEASDIDHCFSNEFNNTMQTISAPSNLDFMHIDDEKPTAPTSNSKSLQENNDVGENKLDSENDCSLIPHLTAEACLDSGRVDRNCKSHLDEMVDIVSDMQKNDTSLEIRNQNEHGDVEIACHAEPAENLPISRDLCLSDTENQLYEAHVRSRSDHVQNEDKQNSPILSSVNDFDQLPGFSELQNSCIEQVENSPTDNQGNCSIDDLLHRSNFETNNEEIIIDSFDECSPECLSNSNLMASPKDNSSVHENDCSSIPHLTADACLDSGRVDRNCKSHIDEMVDIGSDMQKNNISLEIGRNQNDRGDVEIACHAEPAENLPISVDLHLSAMENQLYEAHVRAKSEHVQNEDKQNSPILSSVNDFDQLPGCSELQNRCIDQVENSPKSNQGNCSTDDLLHRSNFEANNEEIIIGSSYVSPPECVRNSNLMASPKSNSSIHEEMCETRAGDNILESLEIEASSRSSSCSTAKSSKFDKILKGEGTSETMSREISEAITTCYDRFFCSPTKDLGLSIPNDNILSCENDHQYVGTKEPDNHKSPEMNGNTPCQNISEHNSETDLLLDPEMCSTYDNAQSEARTTCDDSSFCSPTKDLVSSIPNDDILSRENIQQCMEAKEMENNESSPEMNGNIQFQNENEDQDTATCSTYDNNLQSMELRKSEDAGKRNALGNTSSTNAVPFSEEWLAALEAAGEEILTMKTGAVQNSPPDKSQPEPGPWSPVKRKNNQGIGPFDCTKCTKAGLTP